MVRGIKGAMERGILKGEGELISRSGIKNYSIQFTRYRYSQGLRFSYLKVLRYQYSNGDYKFKDGGSVFKML